MQRLKRLSPWLLLVFFLGLAFTPATAQALPQASTRSEYAGTPSSELLIVLREKIYGLTQELENIEKRSAALEAKIKELETAQTEQEEERTRLSALLKSYSEEKQKIEAEKLRIEKELRQLRAIIVSLVILLVASLIFR